MMLDERTRSFYAASVSSFLAADEQSIVGELSRRTALVHRGNEIAQIQAWVTQIEGLKSALISIGAIANNWGILLEFPMVRLGRRLDAVLLIENTVVVIEFKIGATGFSSGDIEQTEDYALCLRDFHSGSFGKVIVPILCSERAIDTLLAKGFDPVDNITAIQLVSIRTLSAILKVIASQFGLGQISWRAFDEAPYTPTPTIIDAARALYAGHAVEDILRNDALGGAIAEASTRLHLIANQAREQRGRKICFVTGTPGAGKTLLGLKLVFVDSAFRSKEEPAAMLSGNRPLVHVLQEALAKDAASRRGSRTEARRHTQAALQNLLGYLKEHSGQQTPPPENVLVYDEAQRAWDEETGRKLLGRPRSEPALFLEILAKLPWSCLVCLVGPGQEINRGEGGLALWGAALSDFAREGIVWEVHASPIVLRGNLELVGPGLLDGLGDPQFPISEEPKLHLAAGIRTYRNPQHGRWVEHVLGNDLQGASITAARMTNPPAIVTRDMSVLRQWLRDRSRGGRRVGLLASSGATRLIADGIPASPRSNDLDAVGHWFLRPSSDFRSSSALEVPLSEFVCQGLEIDYAGLCWGGDLLWKDNKWMPRVMRAPRWQVVRRDERRIFRLNAYRVLLTRARAGLAIYVPLGDKRDSTRVPTDFDEIAYALGQAGCTML